MLTRQPRIHTRPLPAVMPSPSEIEDLRLQRENLLEQAECLPANFVFNSADIEDILYDDHPNQLACSKYPEVCKDKSVKKYSHFIPRRDDFDRHVVILFAKKSPSPEFCIQISQEFSQSSVQTLGSFVWYPGSTRTLAEFVDTIKARDTLLRSPLGRVFSNTTSSLQLWNRVFPRIGVSLSESLSVDNLLDRYMLVRSKLSDIESHISATWPTDPCSEEECSDFLDKLDIWRLKDSSLACLLRCMPYLSSSEKKQLSDIITATTRWDSPSGLLEDLGFPTLSVLRHVLGSPLDFRVMWFFGLAASYSDLNFSLGCAMLLELIKTGSQPLHRTGPLLVQMATINYRNSTSLFNLTRKALHRLMSRDSEQFLSVDSLLDLGGGADHDWMEKSHEFDGIRKATNLRFAYSMELTLQDWIPVLGSDNITYQTLPIRIPGIYELSDEEEEEAEDPNQKRAVAAIITTLSSSNSSSSSSSHPVSKVDQIRDTSPRRPRGRPRKVPNRTNL